LKKEKKVLPFLCVVRCGFVRELLQGKKEKKKVLISSLWAFLKLFFSYHSGVSEREFLLFFFLFSSIFSYLFIQKNPKKKFLFEKSRRVGQRHFTRSSFPPQPPLPTAKIRRVRPPLEIFVFFDASLDFAILLSFSFFLLPPPPSRGWERVTVCVCGGVCVWGGSPPTLFCWGVPPPPLHLESLKEEEERRRKKASVAIV
jgi:hypothetical protein